MSDNIDIKPLPEATDWSPGFFEKLSAIDPETAAAVDELIAVLRRKLPLPGRCECGREVARENTREL